MSTSNTPPRQQAVGTEKRGWLVWFQGPLSPPKIYYTTGPKSDAGGLLPAQPALDADLNSTARNTNDTAKLRRLVQQGARLDSTNGAPWHHTALHQACYHNRPEIVRTLLELGAYELCAHLPSNPCGRGGSGFPIDLARGGGHHGIVAQLEKYAANHAQADIPQATVVKSNHAKADIPQATVVNSNHAKTTENTAGKSLLGPVV